MKSKGSAYAVVGIDAKKGTFVVDFSYYEGKKETHEKLEFPIKQKADFIRALKEFCSRQNISFVNDLMITGRLWKNKGVSKVI